MPAAPALEPIAVPIPQACLISGLSRSGLYRELAAGKVRAVKAGTRTLVLMDSLRQHVAGLPEARFWGLTTTATP